MNNLFLGFISALLICGWSAPSWAKRPYYFDLKLKDYDEMREKIKLHLQKAQQELAKKGDDEEKKQFEAHAVENLREALNLVLSRPDPSHDNMVSKLLPDVKRRLDELSAFEVTTTSLIDEAIMAAQEGNKLELKPEARMTSQVVLINFINEFKPQLSEATWVKKLMEKIAKTSFSFDKEMHKLAFNRGGIELSPDKLAKKTLNNWQRKQDEKKPLK